MKTRFDLRRFRALAFLLNVSSWTRALLSLFRERLGCQGLLRFIFQQSISITSEEQIDAVNEE